jgi:hypothetical protein
MVTENEDEDQWNMIACIPRAASSMRLYEDTEDEQLDPIYRHTHFDGSDYNDEERDDVLEVAVNHFRTWRLEEYFGLVSSVVRRRTIIMDSGATKHMFVDRAQFTNYRPSLDHMTVQDSAGGLIRILGVGTVGELDECLHVEYIPRDVVSISQLCRNGYATFMCGLIWCHGT